MSNSNNERAPNGLGKEAAQKSYQDALKHHLTHFIKSGGKGGSAGKGNPRPIFG